ncbi:hypothetical protein COCNU_01G021340 [Cocos nucifera]|uniref:Uncharacterized protein n=1 Tax=Cocos nucifera TaxID=13894 RepID=A0A8K0HX75_COCNU|nr:hypothetical protein COCNU_01G021340 [Cocos nucifera]
MIPEERKRKHMVLTSPKAPWCGLAQPPKEGLRQKMEEKRQTKQIIRSKLAVHKKASMKQNAGMVPVVSRREKLMQATTTRLINRIWKDYYNRYFPEQPKEGDDHGLIEEKI